MVALSTRAEHAKPHDLVTGSALMYQNPIEVLSFSLGRTKENIIVLIDEAIQCKSFFKCFVYDHDERSGVFLKYKALLALKLSLKYLLCADSHIYKVKVKYRLCQYFTWKQIDFGGGSRFHLIQAIRRRLYGFFASRLLCNLMKSVGWAISPFAIVEKGFFKNSQLLNISATALSRIEHDVRISNGVALVPGPSRKAGPVGLPAIKEGATIWTGAVIIGATVGKNAVVGANSVVIQDVPDDATVMGNPAKIVSMRAPSQVRTECHGL